MGLVQQSMHYGDSSMKRCKIEARGLRNLVPRRPKSSPGASVRSKMYPRSAQERPRAVQDYPRGAQDAPKSAQERPRAPKSHPRASKKRPRGSQDGPRPCLDRARRAPRRIFSKIFRRKVCSKGPGIVFSAFFGLRAMLAICKNHRKT